MKRLNQRVMAAILTVCGIMMTSCSSEIDNPVKPDAGIMTEADMERAALGLRLDLSGIVMGTDRVRIWDFSDDNKFTAYDYYTTDDDKFYVDTLTGSWKSFANKTLEWDIDQKVQASGINAVFDENTVQPANTLGQNAFYGFNFPDETSRINDDDLFFLSEEALTYLAYLESRSEHPEYYADEEERASTRSDVSSLFNNINNKTVKLLGIASQKVNLTRQSISTRQGQKQKHQEVNNTVKDIATGTNNKSENDAAFNRKTWRSQNTIQLWDGQKLITVQLPWSLNVTNTNLPMNFCADITPANGWDLVVNYCGEKVETIGSSGYHFFALYNKYTGILRFFTYIPENFDANHANDHAWEVTLNEQTAQHLAFRYGLPMDKTIANRTAIGMNGSDYNVYCTPWVASRSKDGYVTPNAGWWAFDVDLSNYRPGYNAALERMRLQMRAWANSSATFNSTLSAKIQKTEGATAYSCNSLMGLVSMFTDVGTNIYQLYGNLSKGAWADAFSAGYALYKTGCNVYTSYRDADITKPKVSVVNTIDGTIETKGLISGTVNVARVTSPDMPMARFDTENTTVGQGVWNIKSSPIVYQLDAMFSYISTMADGNLLKPYFPVIDKTSRNSFLATPCLFDPSSVEVVLNPGVFPKDDIEYVDVKTFCAVRNKTTHDTSNEYRKAFGLTVYNDWTVSKQPVIFSKENKEYNNPAWDYLYDSDNKMGLTYPKVYKDIERDGKVGYSLIGRGDDQALLEPIMFGYDESFWGNQKIGHRLPCYEVTVNLTVKLKSLGTPLTYTRTYLPEVRWLSYSKAKGVVSHAEQWLANLKQEGQAKSPAGTAYQEYQLKHMKSALQFVKPGYENMLDDVTFTEVRGGGDDIRKLFDGNLNSAWTPSIKARVNGSYWECEFKASHPISIKSYTLYNFNKWTDEKSEPTLWAIAAKNEKGDWVQIDQRQNEQPGGNSASKTYQLKVPGTYQEFQLRVVNYNGSLSSFKDWWGANLRLRIAELVFHDK